MLTDFTESHAEYRAWRAGITRTHQRRVRVRVLTLDHRRIAWIDNVLDGQVTIDVTNRETVRVANIRLLDRSRSIGWEPDSPDSLPLHLRRMVQIFDDRAIPGYDWISCPVFTGPVAEFDRDGAEVSLVAEGKERLALGSFGRIHTWAKGRKVVDVIGEILALAGEIPSRIHLPNLAATLPREVNVTRIDKPWVHARKLAANVNRELFFDGRGHVQMRRQPSRASLVLDDDWLQAPVRIDRPKLAFNNRWIILGANPPGDRPRIRADVALPSNHAFSAQSLARNGMPRWLIDQEELSQVNSNARALEIANRKRDDAIRSAAEISLDCLPFPNVEEWDLLIAKDPLTGTAATRVRQATIPLVSGVQTIGAIRRVSRVKRHRGYHPAQHGGL